MSRRCRLFRVGARAGKARCGDARWRRTWTHCPSQRFVGSLEECQSRESRSLAAKADSVDRRPGFGLLARARRELRFAAFFSVVGERNIGTIDRVAGGVGHAERKGSFSHAVWLGEVAVALAGDLPERAVHRQVLEARDGVAAAV